MSFNSSGSGPTLSLGIAHNYGAIWDLSWCPSGTWEPKLSTKRQVWYRYLIVSQCFNSNIRCVKICFNEKLESTVWWRFVKPMPKNAKSPLQSTRAAQKWLCLNFPVFNIKLPGYFLSPKSIMICRFTSVMGRFECCVLLCFSEWSPFPFRFDGCGLQWWPCSYPQVK